MQGAAGRKSGLLSTTVARLNAVTHRRGPSPIAFAVLPLVSANPVDPANMAVIETPIGF